MWGPAGARVPLAKLEDHCKERSSRAAESSLLGEGLMEMVAF